MAAEDSSPGSGAGGAPPAAGGAQGAATPTQAQGQAAGGVSREEIAQMLQASHDRMFADLRRAGVLGKEKEQGSGGGAPAGAAPTPPSSGTSPAPPVTEEVQRIVDRQRAFDRATGGVQMSEGARKRMESAFAAEKPEDVAGWAKAYLGDFGLVGAEGSSPSSQQQTTTQTMERRGAGVTNVPAPAGVAPSEVRDPYSLTKDDVAAMVRRDGIQKTGAKLMDALRSAPPKRLLLPRR
jgi:hypothetical protein